MARKRLKMAISKKFRFEVFKRDGFQCQYCGKSSPKVVLEIDHVIPKNEGGQDNLENLITSCFDCNRGKGKELLENYKEGTDPWIKTFGERPVCPANVIMRALNFIPREKILEAIDVCYRGYTKYGDKSWNESILAYFYGIIRSMTNDFNKEE